MPPSVLTITSGETRPLRHAVLRPNQPPEACVYPLDDHPDAFHLGVRAGGELVGVASFYREPAPDSERSDLRIRGMAVLQEHRGRGLGRAMVERGLAVAGAHAEPPATAWCNARLTAAAYYERLGFERRGGVFEIEGIGPHAVMVRSIGVVS